MDVPNPQLSKQAEKVLAKLLPRFAQIERASFINFVKILDEMGHLQ
jgi:hypothetical protein